MMQTHPMDMPRNYRHSRPTIGVLAGWQVYQGVLLPGFISDRLSGIQAAAQALGCNLLLACGVTAEVDKKVFPAWPFLSPEHDFLPVGPWNTDGLIVLAPTLSETRSEYIQALRAAGHPVVFINAGEAGPAVMLDNVAGVRHALEHLMAHGHRAIAFIAGIEGEPGDTRQRLETYQAAVKEFGLVADPRLIAYGFHQEKLGQQAMEAILNSGVTFTAVLAANDFSAMGALRALRAAGRRVPEDVALISFDDVLQATAQTPPLTSIRYPAMKAGYWAVELILQLLHQPVAEPIIKYLPAQLVIRESCGCGPVGVLPLEPPTVSKEGPTVLESLAQAIAQTILAEARHLDPLDVHRFCQQWVQAFVASVADDSELFQALLAERLQQVEAVDDDLHVWQIALLILEVNLAEVLEAVGQPDRRAPAEALLRQARLLISEAARRQYRQYLYQQQIAADQTGLLNARLLTALDEQQILATLTAGLPALGIRHAQVIFFAPEGDPNTPGASDPVAWSILYSDPAKPPQKFLSREFPPPDLYPEETPFHLALLPLVIQEQQAGFVAFEAANLLPCADIARQLAAAFKSARLFQKAIEGQRLAEEANRLKSRFLSTVSHELRAPLNLIVGLSEMLLRQPPTEAPPLPEPYRRDVTQIQISAQHLDGLIRDVLDLSRSEAGELSLICEVLDLKETLQTVAAIGEQLAHNHGLTWQLNIPDKLPRVWGDPLRLRQVLLNFIHNAVKFTQRGQITLEVKRTKDEGSRTKAAENLSSREAVLRLPSSQEYLLIRVSDTGLGIPLTEQAVIFDEFRQSERTTARGYGGLGLGLAICRRLVELHGGQIGVRSSGEEGAGSTFYFTLPILTELTAPPADSLAGQTVWLLSAPLGGSELLRTHLRQQGFVVEERQLRETSDWLSPLRAARPAAVVLDAAIAAQRGWEVLRLLKTEASLQDLPVLFYALESAAQAGAVLELDYLMKPVSPAALTQALARHGIETSTPEGTKTILVVDDEAGIRDMHTRMLQTHSAYYRVLQASNGREAMEIIRQVRPDLLLLDLMMPELDGFGVLEAMQAETVSRDIPVIVLTGQTLTEADMVRLNQGVTTVLSKGVFSAPETLSQVAAALTRSRKLGSETQRLVRKAIAYLHQHYAEHLSRESIARYTGVSEGYLTRCFQQELGVAPMAYLSRYRINRAKALLTDSRLSVTAVAMAAGFSSGAYFSEVFQREVGVSPLAYRRIHHPRRNQKKTGETR